jgi:hypothetical protein
MWRSQMSVYRSDKKCRAYYYLKAKYLTTLYRIQVEVINIPLDYSPGGC